MRNLEEEYRKSQQEETPDLWERIEAGLPEKKRSKRRYPVRYMGVAAAALFLLILIPNLRNLKSRDMAQENQMYDEAAPGENNAPPAPVKESEPSEDFLAQDEASGMDNAAYEVEDIGADAAMETNEDADVQDDLQEALQDNMTPDAAASGTEALEGAAGYSREMLKVADSSWYGERKVYTLCTQAGEERRAVLGEGLEQELRTGESYTFTMEEVEGEAWEYVIQAVE